MTNQGTEGTALLTLRGLLIRDSESFGPRFWAARGTVGVPSAPRKRSLERETFRHLAEFAQTLAETGRKRKTPGGRSLGAGRKLACRLGS